MTAREAARRFIDSVFEAEWASDESLPDAVEHMSPEDRGLFTEISHGTLREWLFLSWAISRHAARAPRGPLRTVLNLSAYQLLFLDRVPEYAIFSEAAAMSSGLGVSEPELKFVHGVLKSVQREKPKLLEVRQSVLARAEQGNLVESELDLAVLNAPPHLIDALTVVEEKGKRRVARVRAIRAVAAMKERSRLIGYALPGQEIHSVTASLMSEVAPRALILKSSDELNQDLRAGAVRIQGEASQWACEVAAKELARQVEGRTDKPLRILEMAAGKGGKLLGTLAAWTRQLGGRPEAVPPIEWVAVDAADLQLRVFELDTAPLVRKTWPQVRLKWFKSDWRSAQPQAFPGSGFDLVWLDAPCTGYGTLSKLPQIALKRGNDAYGDALKMAAVQQELSLKGLEHLTAKGAFMFTACTMTLPETFGVTNFCSEKLGRNARFVGSLWPGMPPARTAEGFFAALF